MHPRLTTPITLLMTGLLASCGDTRSPAPPLASPVVVGIDAEAAYRRAVALQREGHHLESLPYFRRALDAHAQVSQLHLEYGQALHNAAIETDIRFGFVRFLVPSSQERLTLAKEAILEVRRSAQLARTTTDHAYALYTLARMQRLMGLQADALESVSTARALAPDVEVLRQLEASQKMILMDRQGE